VANATSVMMVFWSKLTSSLAFWIQGDVHTHHMMFIGTLMLVASLFASLKIKNLIKKLRRPSVLSFMFVFFNGVALAVTVWFVGGAGMGDGINGMVLESYCDNQNN
jgi:uncharacterized membrane protein YfcA